MGTDKAQKRVDQINSFYAELTVLESEAGFSLDEEAAASIRDHHDKLIDQYSSQFDIDTTGSEKQLSWGMRIASFLGAIALSAALVLFFQRYWGELSITLQVFVLIVGPLLGLGLAEFLSRLEKSPYFTSLASLVAFAAFVLNLSVLGSIFNITPSQNAFLLWGGFAFLLAYAYGLRLLQVAGIACLTGYLSATVGTWSGCYWLNMGERPENFIAAGFAIFLMGVVIPHRQNASFKAMYRLFGLLSAFMAMLVLANWGRISYLVLPVATIEGIYQTAGFATGALAVWVGIRKSWKEVVNIGVTFFTLFLYTKMYDWLWELMPKWMFFLLVGGIAIGLLIIMTRVRGLVRTRPAEVSR
jgi:uncharacterized membrane protein